MVRHLANVLEHGYDWIDVTNPDNDELLRLAEKYELHAAMVNDCLQPDHLPKYEKTAMYSFIIFRIHSENDVPEADTVQELTNKIAIFYSGKFIITVHRQKQNLIEQLSVLVPSKSCNNSYELLNALVYACLNTYEGPLNSLAKSVDKYEEVVFLRAKRVSLLKGLYYLKRKIDLIRRMLILSSEIIDFLDAETGNVSTRETRDEYVKLQHMFAALSENVHQLLNIYFSASSQRTNDTMRVLTIFSVFFMPLTFIVGIYGMNFDFMPEMRWRFGYPAVMILMAGITLAIYLWFKRKQWL